MTLTYTGRILLFGRTQITSDCFWNANGMAHWWHPGEFNVSGAQDNIMVYSAQQTLQNKDLFCSGHVVLPDGKVVIVGGTELNRPPGEIWGLSTTFVFDPAGPSFAQCNRDCSGQEVDLLLRFGTHLVPIEVKLHSTPGSDDSRAVRRCMRDLGCRRGYLVYPGSEDYSLGGGVTALSAERLLADPRRVTRL